jgi:hypothetical protein
MLGGERYELIEKKIENLVCVNVNPHENLKNFSRISESIKLANKLK